MNTPKSIYASTREYRDDIQSAVSWINRQAQGENRFFRVAIKAPDKEGNHSLLDLGTLLQVPSLKIGFTPALHFKHGIDVLNEKAFRPLSIRYLITNEKDNPYASFTLKKQFGDLKVFEYLKWNPAPYSISKGQGNINLLHFSDEEIVLRAHPGAKGRLLLHISFFSRWQATRDNQPIKINRWRHPQAPLYELMSVRLKPGIYRFQFRRTWIEFTGYALSIAGFLICFSLIFWKRIKRVMPKNLI